MVRTQLHRLGQTGTSLTEAMLVAAIVGVLAVIASPFLLSYWRASTLESGAREVQTILNTARQLAIKQNTSVQVLNDGTRVQLQFRQVVGGVATWVNSVGPGTDSNGWMTLNNGVQVTGSTANVAFTYLGAASPAGTYTVRNPADGRTITVTVATSGRVTIP